ncbi:MAG: helix-turn-helix transcriptional regulator [Deferribacteraceae bacterium]|jgi:MerR family transcriptional regulator/heat shock protein HspR|nr:helix-turn-helix transcriptional regulator [Deferribacteraceae bacterium]
MKKGSHMMIGVVSELLGLHPQTIRQYERQGLISPERTDGNTRRYSDEDLERLKFITALTRDMGINLAGVEMIVNMKDEIAKLEDLLEEVSRARRGDFTWSKSSKESNEEPIVVKVVRQKE